ncbi:polysaccharide biosynthesis protein [Fulvivirga sp. M361]|uniref:polysaccharide biosynthesis protein n=1 Tax=Fulvivirga sp. M361 TaxID=2594266 RepID=UPI00117BBB7A|nr:nucleoside-diphosphate sugar epimerase/dehydratase [Fulvivirga sp. M361]TRX50243.1 polysaccharide biosynthesis protein [Fulvivirga sp. M361]
MSVTKQVLKLRILPRWVIIIIDSLIIILSSLLAYLLRFNFDWVQVFQFNLKNGILANLLSFLVATFLTKSYSGIVRYTGIHDGKRLLSTLFLMGVVVTFMNLVFFYFFRKNLIPYSIILITLLASFVALFQYRLLIKNIFSYYRSANSGKVSVAIFGAGELGIVTQSVLLESNDVNYKIEAFFEDDNRKVGKVINGTRIYSGGDDFARKLRSLGVQEMIISTQNLDTERTNELVDICLNHEVRVRSVPSLDQWVRGELSIKQIREVRIDDLLGRASIRLNNEKVKAQITGKCICVTGAAGSIGSELVRLLIYHKPEQVVLIDQSESALYELQREISDKVVIKAYVADITDELRIDQIFQDEQPEIVFHAAAYKHVPLMELNTVEAIKTNILGTKCLADISLRKGVRKFVMVSTDKAVNPTSVMGCSKRLAEMYVQSLNNRELSQPQKSSTVFVTTRFGNVLGSNGSVIPVFKKQIMEGGPITVTHPEITRFFMTIREACQLILEAGAMARGGEIFIFDMGKSVKIVDLAKKMIKLSGLELDKDIEIVFTGLREGEKLYEELLADKENTMPTHHEKIMIAKTQRFEYELVDKGMKSLKSAIDEGHDSYTSVSLMKALVPEYKSNSSIYEVLDGIAPPQI